MLIGPSAGGGDLSSSTDLPEAVKRHLTDLDCEVNQKVGQSFLAMQLTNDESCDKMSELLKSPEVAANTISSKHKPHAWSKLGQRRRRWSNIDPEMGQWFVLAV